MITWEIVQWCLVSTSVLLNFVVLGNITDLKKYVSRGEFVVDTVERINKVQLKK